MADYRINRDVSPYGGKRLLAVAESQNEVTGWVLITNRRTATELRTYRRDELTEIE